MKKSILSLLSTAIGVAVGGSVVDYRKIKQREMDYKTIQKMQADIKMLNQWLILKQNDKRLDMYFRNNNLSKIAIYGMNYAGERLLDDLKNTDIKVEYAIDQDAESILTELEVIHEEDVSMQEPVEAIIVAEISSFDEIIKRLSLYIDCPIMSLEDIIFEL